MDHTDTVNNHPWVLVTGANSLLGTHVIACLLSEGYRVNGLLRDRTRFHLPPHPNLELIEGDFTKSETVLAAVQACDYVIHVAACTDQGIPDYGYYYKINVEATRQLFMLALKSGNKRFVYVSTANCFGFGSKACPGDETYPACCPFTDSHYARSKREAQEMLLRRKHLMDVVIVNPTFMLGAYGTKKGSGQIVLRAYGHKMVFCPPGGKNFINAADAGMGVVDALERGANGEAYLLSGENLSYKEFYHRMSSVTGKKIYNIVLPKFILLTFGVIGNLLRIMKIPNRFTLTNMKMLCVGNYYTGNKAAREIGLKAEAIDRGISETIDWFSTDL